MYNNLRTETGHSLQKLIARHGGTHEKTIEGIQVEVYLV
jgi:hypothetical protein